MFHAEARVCKGRVCWAARSKEVCGTRLETLPGLVLKGLVHRAQEFRLGLKAVTAGFGPQDGRATFGPQTGPLPAVRGGAERAGGRLGEQGWPWAVAQGGSDQGLSWLWLWASGKETEWRGVKEARVPAWRGRRAEANSGHRAGGPGGPPLGGKGVLLRCRACSFNVVHMLSFYKVPGAAAL